MKSKQQKRKEACERIKASLLAAEKRVVETHSDLSKSIGKYDIAFYGSADGVKLSRTKAYESAVNIRNRMQREIAHLDSL